MKQIGSDSDSSDAEHIEMENIRPSISDTPDVILQKGLELHNRLLKKRCIETFERLMEKYPAFNKGRVMFSFVLEKYGNMSYSCEILETGILPMTHELPETERPSQFELCCATGNQYFKAYKSWKTFRKSFKGLGKDDVLIHAEKWGRECLRYYPEKIEGLELLGKVLQEMGRIEEAQGYWEQLISLKDVKETKYLHTYARNLDPDENFEDIKKCYERILRINRNDWESYEQLSIMEPDKSQSAELLRKSKYYCWLAPFCKDARYTTQNFNYFYRLVAKDKQPNFFESFIPNYIPLGWKARFNTYKSTLEDLVANDNIYTTNLLVSYVYNHVHPMDIRFIFEELSIRSEKVQVQDLLFSLMCDPKSEPIIVRTSSKILARRKYPKLYAKLIELLPIDMCLRDQDFGVVESLGLLQDPRTVDVLIGGMGIHERISHKKHVHTGVKSLGHLRYRKRCCLSLGCFRNGSVEVRGKIHHALRNAMKVSKLKVHASVGLFHLTGKAKYLSVLKSAISKKWVLPGYDIYDFFYEHQYDYSDDGRAREIMKDILVDYNSQIIIADAQLEANCAPGICTIL